MFGALYCLLGYRQTGSKRYLLLAGLSWGLAYLSRTINLISLPIYLVVLVLVIQRSVGRTLRIAPLYTFYRLIVRNWRAFANFLIPIIMAGFCRSGGTGYDMAAFGKVAIWMQRVLAPIGLQVSVVS